jgi:hypothetical protein
MDEKIFNGMSIKDCWSCIIGIPKQVWCGTGMACMCDRQGACWDLCGDIS